LLVRPNGVACAFSASLSHRSPKLRWLAATSGELANLARRAHSAAWARQYITYDDIARSHTTRTAHTLTFRGRHALNSSGAYCPIIAIYAVMRPGKR